jgi:hypothetical protein
MSTRQLLFSAARWGQRVRYAAQKSHFIGIQLSGSQYSRVADPVSNGSDAGNRSRSASYRSSERLRSSGMNGYIPHQSKG